MRHQSKRSKRNLGHKTGLLRKMQAPTVPTDYRSRTRGENGECVRRLLYKLRKEQADTHTHTHKHARLFVDRGGSIARALKAPAAGLGRVPHKILSDGDASLPYEVLLVVHEVSVVARAWHRDWREDLL